jgi:uncharacterized membrane protein
MQLVVSPLVAALSAIGLLAALFMQAKANRYAQGLESEASVVQQPRARVFGVTNSAIGIVYYALMLACSWLLSVPAVLDAALVAAALAAALSVYLAYSLLFVTRMPCPYCWTGHVVNWLLVVLLAADAASRPAAGG